MGQLEDRLVASADLLQEGIVLERGFESCFWGKLVNTVLT